MPPSHDALQTISNDWNAKQPADKVAFMAASESVFWAKWGGSTMGY